VTHLHLVRVLNDGSESRLLNPLRHPPLSPRYPEPRFRQLNRQDLKSPEYQQRILKFGRVVVTTGSLLQLFYCWLERVGGSIGSNIQPLSHRTTLVTSRFHNPSLESRQGRSPQRMNLDSKNPMRRCSKQRHLIAVVRFEAWRWRHLKAL